MMGAKAYSPLLVVLFGSLDCITTVIGILFFGAVELNPFLVSMVSTNLLAFIVLKSVTTVFVGLIFYKADKILKTTQNKSSRAFTVTHYLLRAAYVGIVAFLIIVVSNNILVLARAI